MTCKSTYFFCHYIFREESLPTDFLPKKKSQTDTFLAKKVYSICPLNLHLRLQTNKNQMKIQISQWTLHLYLTYKRQFGNVQHVALTFYIRSFDAVWPLGYRNIGKLLYAQIIHFRFNEISHKKTKKKKKKNK